MKGILALIPARGGSRRVKNKNIHKLAGKPLIAYTIEAALKSKLVERVVVTTDSPAIAAVARRYGAEVPFLRPKAISTAEATEFQFHAHALWWLKEHEGYEPRLVVNLYPTSPFKKSSTIDAAIKKMLANPKADSLRSVRKCSEHPHKMWVKAKGGLLKPFVPSKKRGSQALAYHLLPEVFIQNASIYITKPATLRKFCSTIGKRVVAFEMSETESTDINTPVDLILAEALMAHKT